MRAATRHKYCQLLVRVTEQFVSLDCNKKPTFIPTLLIHKIRTLESAEDEVNDKATNSFTIAMESREGQRKFLEITNTWIDEEILTLAEEDRFSLIF